MAVDLTTYVIDDDEEARNSLTFLLRAEGLRARSFPSAITFLEHLDSEARGCVITDVRMPDMDGIELMAKLIDLGSSLPVIVITGHADVALAVRAMKVGAADFIEKPYDYKVILKSVRGSLALSETNESKQSIQSQVDRRFKLLTAREAQVCDLVGEGKSNKDIALALNISPRTVEIHRANVMTKMEAASLSELVRMIITRQAE